MDVQQVLEQLAGFGKHQEYDQDGTFRLVHAITKLCIEANSTANGSRPPT